MARAARAASQVAMGIIDDVRLAVQFATGVSILSREEKTALLKVKGYFNKAWVYEASTRTYANRARSCFNKKSFFSFRKGNPPEPPLAIRYGPARVKN